MTTIDWRPGPTAAPPPAAPATPGGAPPAHPAAPGTARTAPTAPPLVAAVDHLLGPRRRPHAPAGPGPGPAPAAAPATPGAAPGTGTPASDTPGHSGERAMTAVSAVAAVGAVIVALVGFVGSYRALADLGESVGLDWFAAVFPIGIDAAIVVLLALDLHLIRKGTPWPLLRLAAHGMTAATIWFNAASGGSGRLWEHPTAAAAHAVIPVGFVLAVEAARRLVIRAVRLETGHGGSVPVHRWLLAPRQSWRLYRRMRLWAIPSYTEALAIEQELVVYREMLARAHDGNWKLAPADARLPLTMAPYGLSVAQALAEPQRAAEAERLRAEQAAEWEAQAAERAAERQAQAQARAAERAARTRIAQLQADTTVQAAEAEAAAAAGTAQARAQAATATAQAEAEAAAATAEAAATAAARTAAAETRALDTAAAAEARQRAAEAEQAKAEAEQAKAEALTRAAAAQRRAAEEDAAKAQAEARQRAALAAAAADTRKVADEEEAAAEAAKRAAVARALAAEAELRALDAEDTARLTPRERAARKVARMILAEAEQRGTRPDPELIDLQTIMDTLAVSQTTASDRRREAADLLAAGYHPAA
ncbi:DUF2637 domain-containing protein [Kitasatospora sp. NPDC015120]|uniref:DUF2637 domain-containing protein n=1 Tax=Kitasatospora sp. NPDC015120 TaxID=3364023 RepID=UPI0036F478BD